MSWGEEEMGMWRRWGVRVEGREDWMGESGLEGRRDRRGDIGLEGRDCLSDRGLEGGEDRRGGWVRREGRFVG